MEHNTSKQKGIYCWINKINNKRYVGQTGCRGGFIERWRHERYCLNNHLSHRMNNHFCYAWKKYGAHNFDVVILEVINNPTSSLLLEREQYWCDFYKTHDRQFGYNQRACVESNLGITPILSKESQARKSALLSAMNSGENSPKAKLSWRKVRKIRSKYRTGKHSLKQLAKEYEVNATTIGRIIHNKIWIDPNYQDLGTQDHFAKGENSGRSKLTTNEVLLIRKMCKTQQSTYEEIATEFGVCSTTIYLIATKKTWKHLK